MSCPVSPNPATARPPIEYSICRAGLDGRAVVVVNLFFWDQLEGEELAASVHHLLSRVEATGPAAVALLAPQSYRHTPEQTQDAVLTFVSRLRHCCAVVACLSFARGGYVVVESTDAAFPVGGVIPSWRLGNGGLLERCGDSRVLHGGP